MALPASPCLPAQILSQLMPAPTPEESLDEHDMQLTKECSEIRAKLRQVKLSNQVGSTGLPGLYAVYDGRWFSRLP